MARSTYIYVAKMYGEIIGTFTVKHELLSWVGREVKIPKLLTVERHSDGPRLGYKPVDISEEFNGRT